MAKDNFFRSNYVPPTAFYFSVKFGGNGNMDSSFQEISGLKVTMGVEEKKEGGENDFALHLPTPAKYDNLVLKRCLLPNSNLEKWCRNAFENFKFDPKDIQLALIGADGTPLASWQIVQAYPVSWELATLNSETNELAIETLTLKYRHFRKD